MKVKSYKEALDYLFEYIPKNTDQRFPGEIGLQRTKYLLKLLGNPQNTLKVVHTAGTSGKGSTSYLISHILRSLGFTVGLHLSPFLIDIRERYEINNQYIAESELVNYLNYLIPFIEEVGKTEWGIPKYFEINVALAFLIFKEKKVDYAVIETGLGGLLDATNTVDNPDKVAVITKIGLDHTQILGDTIDKIAYQKAMIMHNDNIAISTWQDKQAEEVLKTVAKQQGAQLRFLNKNSVMNVRTKENETVFNLHLESIAMNDISVSMIGEYQAENAAMALTTVHLLSQRDRFFFDEKKIREALSKAHFPGRMDIIHLKGKTVILDGAHNPQKMSALIHSLQKIFPHRKFDFLVGFKRMKDAHTMLDSIRSSANTIVTTSFTSHLQTQSIFAHDPQELVDQIGTDISAKAINNSYEAFEYALDKADDILVVTGSLYLLAGIYEYLQDQNLT